MKAVAILFFGALALLLCLTTVTHASTVGTPANEFEYSLTDEEVASYRERVELDLFNLQSASGHCEPFNQAICGDIIPTGTSIYVSDSQTQEDLTTQLTDAFFLLRVTEAGECRESMVAFLCSQFFPLCTVNYATLAPQSNQPCYPICQRFNETCPQLVDRFALLPDQLKPLCASSTSGECGYHIDPTKVQAVDIRPCPDPLVAVNDNGILGGTCEEPCPILMWSKAEYRRMDIMSEVLGIFSLVTSAFITLTWLVFPKMRQKQFIFWFFVCSFFLSLFLWIGLRLRGTDVAASVNCKTDTEEYQMAGYCLWQGMTTIYFLIAGTAWWMVQSLDVFLKVVLEIRFLDGATSTRVRDIGYHVFSWGIGAICLIGALASRQIGGYNNGASFCLFSQGRNGTGTDVSYGFFYYPLIVMSALGVIAIGATLVKLIIFKFSTKSAITVSSFVRIFILVLTMLGVCIIIVIYKFLAADRVDIWRESAEEFYTCLLFAEDNPYEDIDCGSSPKLRMPIALKFLYDLIPIAPGILCFLCYGIQTQLYTVWLGLFYDKCGCACGKRFSENKKDNSYTDRSTNQSQQSTQNTQNSVTTQNGDTNKPATKKGMFKGTAATRRPGQSGNPTAIDTNAQSSAGLLPRDSSADVSTTESIRPSQVELQDM